MNYTVEWELEIVGEGSVFVSFKTQGQLIPEAFQFLLIFVKDQQMY